MKRRIQIVGHDNIGSMFPGEFTTSSKFIHCVDCTSTNNSSSNSHGNSSYQDEQSSSRVVVEWGPASEDFSGSGALDVMIRYRCGAFPFSGSFYLLIYNDPYQCQLHEVKMWQLHYIYNSIVATNQLMMMDD